MDIPKLQGIISAIEEESRVPSPSHSNLARLLGMFCREFLSDFGPPRDVTETVAANPLGATVDINSSTEPKESAPAKRAARPLLKKQSEKKR